MKYIFVLILGFVFGVFVGIYVSSKVVFDFWVEKMYDEVLKSINSILSWWKIQFDKQKELILKEIEYKKKQLKEEIKNQIKQAINEKIDELFNF